MQKNLNHSRSQCVLQSSPLSAEVHNPLICGARVRGAWHALASVVMVAGWSAVFCPCSTSVCLCAALAVFFPFFSFSTSPSSLCLCVSIPPSLLQHPPIPLLHHLSPPLRHPGCFLVVVISNSACLFLRLKELPVLVWFSPDYSVLFDVSLLSTSFSSLEMTGHVQVTAQPTGETNRCVAFCTAVHSLSLHTHHDLLHFPWSQ